ncbi:MAG: hypothetical protein AAB768_00060 [Patescibacteria group bacterium]
MSRVEIGPVAGGVQIDVNVAIQKIGPNLYRDARSCDHNCTSKVGGYDCPAAFTLNQTVDPKTYAPKEKILASLEVATEGVERANNVFVESGLFDKYCQDNYVPQDIAVAYLGVLSRNQTEINFFGGNPEMHPEIPEMVQTTKAEGHKVNLTTTGRKFIRNHKFTSQIINAHPDLIALSYDFSNPSEITKMGGMDPDRIRAEWRELMRIHPTHGQRQKVFESAYVAQIAKKIEDFPKVLFNLVLHSGNINQAVEIIISLTEAFPGVLVNPYFEQTAFLGKQSDLNKKLDQLNSLVDWSISEQLSDDKKTNLVPRLYWWLMIKAAIETHSGNPSKTANAVGGKIWKCYQEPGAGRYFQIGTGIIPYTNTQTPGLRPNCFWNDQTIADNRRANEMKPDAIADYILYQSGEIAHKSPLPCQGCAFPRLNFDIISTEIGMDKTIKPTYLKLRREHMGF